MECLSGLSETRRVREYADSLLCFQRTWSPRLRRLEMHHKSRLRLVFQPSMSEQATDRTFLQEIPGHAAKRPFPEPRVSVSARDHQVDVFVLDQPKERI